MARKESIDLGELTDPAFYILSSVVEEKHGYLIMKTIEQYTGGQVSIGPASLYTTLKKLLGAELVKLNEETGDGKKVYSITEKGKEMLQKEIERKKKMINFAENFLKGESIDGI